MSTSMSVSVAVSITVCACACMRVHVCLCLCLSVPLFVVLRLEMEKAVSCGSFDHKATPPPTLLDEKKTVQLCGALPSVIITGRQE